MRLAEAQSKSLPRRASGYSEAAPNEGSLHGDASPSFRPAPARNASAVVGASRWVGTGLLAIVALAPTGCGYHWAGDANAVDPGYSWKGLYREDVKTVAVPIFTNRTYYRGVEFDLTKAVINQIESRTPYKVAQKDRADTILEGEVARVSVRTLSQNQFNALPQEQLYQIVVNFTWKDMRSGKILATRHFFEQTAPYYPTLGEDQFAGNQQNVERLALAIVEQLQAEWGNARQQ